MLGINAVSAKGRVENQKLNETAALLSFGWAFGFQLDILEKNITIPPGFTFSIPLLGMNKFFPIDIYLN